MSRFIFASFSVLILTTCFFSKCPIFYVRFFEMPHFPMLFWKWENGAFSVQSITVYMRYWNVALRMHFELGQGAFLVLWPRKEPRFCEYHDIFEFIDNIFHLLPKNLTFGQRREAPDIPKISRFIPKIPSSCSTNFWRISHPPKWRT